jgi:glycosyltransferase involved in cell wall biosynthesis
MFPGGDSEEELDGVELHRRGGRLAVYSKAKEYCKNFANDFDLVVDEINTRPFMTPRYVRRKPIVALIHQLAREYWFYEVPWPLSWIGYYYLEKAWLSHYQRVTTITVSESTKRDLLDWGFTNIHTVPEGISVPLLAELPEKEDRPTLLFVGRLKRVKKPDHAIRAFQAVRERIPGTRLWIVGSGYLRERLEHIAIEGVEFMGRVEESIKIDLMTRAHVLLFPAVREGWGLTITEANARGTVAVAYDVPGVRDAIKNNETGILVPRDDYEALASGACSLLENERLRRDMASGALQRAKTMSWEETCEAVAQVCLEAERGALVR